MSDITILKMPCSDSKMKKKLTPKLQVLSWADKMEPCLSNLILLDVGADHHSWSINIMNRQTNNVWLVNCHLSSWMLHPNWQPTPLWGKTASYSVLNVTAAPILATNLHIAPLNVTNMSTKDRHTTQSRDETATKITKRTVRSNC